MKIIRETMKINIFTREVEYSNRVVLYNDANIKNWRDLEKKILSKVKRSPAGTPSWYKQGNRIEARMKGGKEFLFRLTK